MLTVVSASVGDVLTVSLELREHPSRRERCVRTPEDGEDLPLARPEPIPGDLDHLIPRRMTMVVIDRSAGSYLPRTTRIYSARRLYLQQQLIQVTLPTSDE